MMTKEDDVAHIGKLERAEIEEAIQQVYEKVKKPRLSDLKEILLKHPETQIKRFGRIMAPWLQYSSNRVFFIKDAALAVSPATATEELAQKYLELTGSIVVPSQPKIILN
jgi:hypothetical protein